MGYQSTLFGVRQTVLIVIDVDVSFSARCGLVYRVIVPVLSFE